MRKMRLLIAVAVAVLAFATAPPAAADVGSGNISYEVTASLPVYPCAPPGCGGSFNGTSVGTLSGVHGTSPWAVQWALGAMSGSFSYSDSCYPVGLAVGSGTLAASVGAVAGTYGPAAGSVALPAPIVGVSAPFTFKWTRLGNTAIIEARVSVYITIPSGAGFTTFPVVSNHLTPSVAAFAPLNVPGMCGGSTPLTAIVAGSAEVAA